MDSSTQQRRLTTNDRLTILEVKMDAATEHMSKFSLDSTEAFEKLNLKLNRMDLNGHTDLLKQLARDAPEVIKNTKRLTALLPILEALAAQDMESRIAKRWIKRKFQWANSRLIRGLSTAITGTLVYVILVQMGVGAEIVKWLTHL